MKTLFCIIPLLLLTSLPARAQFSPYPAWITRR